MGRCVKINDVNVEQVQEPFKRDTMYSAPVAIERAGRVFRQ